MNPTLRDIGSAVTIEIIDGCYILTASALGIVTNRIWLNEESAQNVANYINSTMNKEIPPYDSTR